MLEPIKNTSCQLGCWAISGAAAVLTFIMCFGLGEIAFMGAVFLPRPFASPWVCCWGGSFAHL